jgi:hypothetical protein
MVRSHPETPTTKERVMSTRLPQVQQTIPLVKFEALMEEARGVLNSSVHSVLIRIGYSGNSVTYNWRQRGRVPKIAYYALLGVISKNKRVPRAVSPTPVVSTRMPAPSFTKEEIDATFFSLIETERVTDAETLSIVGKMRN